MKRKIENNNLLKIKLFDPYNVLSVSKFDFPENFE